MPEQDVKVIDRVEPSKSEIDSESNSSWDKYFIFVSVFGGFLVLISLINLLSLDFSIQILTILVGSFLLVDLHKTLKIKSNA